MTFRSNIGFLPAVALALTACAVPATDVPPTAEIKKPALVNSTPEKPRAKVSSISLEVLFQLHQSDKALILDARPSFIYQFGHIPGAINLPKNRCDEAIVKREAEFRNATAAGKTIVVYCTGLKCPDARAVANHLGNSGISASVFAGGWDAWQEAGLPVE